LCSAIIDNNEIGANWDGLIYGDKNFGNGTGDRGGNFGINFVGRNFKERLIDSDLIAFVFEPTSYGAFGNALTKRRHHNIK
jgi:hypothetical protein